MIRYEENQENGKDRKTLKCAENTVFSKVLRIWLKYSSSATAISSYNHNFPLFTGFRDVLDKSLDQVCAN